MAWVYYNEIDAFAADLLEQLIARGHIAPGVVDRRSIEDVRPSDLKGFTQCHFFAGIGGWSLALRGAGWPDDRPAWTGSCPCQPFSQAGKRGGLADERHLWPAFQWLIEQRTPDFVFGEQVASKDGIAWFDVVQADLERTGYAVGAADLCAAGFGAPHIRPRLYWGAIRLADRDVSGLERRRQSERERPVERVVGPRVLVGGMANQDSDRRGARLWNDPGPRHGYPTAAAGFDDRQGLPGPVNGHWQSVDWLRCRDDRWRPVEPGTFPLAHGIPARVGLLRGYGNAIVPQVATEVIRAFMEYMNELEDLRL